MSNLTLSIHPTVLSSALHLTKNEKRVLWLLISGIGFRSKVTPRTPYYASVERFAELANLPFHRALDKVQEVATSLMGCYLEYKEAGTTVRISFVTKVTLNREERTVAVEFNPDFIPFVSDLVKKFAKLNLLTAFQFKSLYTWKLHDYFISKKYSADKSSVPEFTIDRLEELLAFPSSYRKFKVLNDRIIKPMILELESLKIAKVSLSYRKIGRRVIAFTFHVTWWGAKARVEARERVRELVEGNYQREECQIKK